MGKDRPEHTEADQHGRPTSSNGGAIEPSGDGDTATAQGPAEAPAPAPTRTVQVSRRGVLVILNKALHLAAALFLFILAIRLMSRGADALAPRLQGTFPVDNMVSTMGLGWLGAYLVLSGSPIAAASLALFDADAITRAQTFTMLTGSRLGAAFIVLLVGFLYAMRSRTKQRRQESIGMGVLALSLTAIVYIPGMMLGYGLLKSGAFDWVSWHASADVEGVIEVVWDPIRDVLANLLPGPLLFPLGLAVILASFKLLDYVLPSLDGEKHAGSRSHWLRKPWPMFFLGSLAAFLTLSVSVALTILVPLASKGYIRRSEAIPYIMGANITTLADTLVAAMLLANPVAVQVVLTEAIGVSIVTLFLLAFLYRPLQSGVMALDQWIVATTPRLVLFVAVLFLTPVALLFSGRLL
jgi:solute carrier family 34 (sodium-dependent phosphate cotransporter)